MTASRGPELLLIGAARSGTTLLSRLLAQRGGLAFSDPKEPHFLAFAGERVEFAGPGDAASINRVAITDTHAWHSLFAPEGQAARAEGSVSTLYYHERSIPNIRRHCPDARMIALLRDPTQRAFSAWSYMVGKGYEDAGFERALELEESRIAGNWHHIWHYTRLGRYDEQVAAFLEAFGTERVLFVGYEDLVADPSALLSRCFTFAGLDEPAPTSLGPTVNGGGKPRSQLLQGGLTWMRERELLRRTLHNVVPEKLRERARSASLEKMSMPEHVRVELDERFAGVRSSLCDLLGDEAPTWAHGSGEPGAGDMAAPAALDHR
jgi:hypothetical protein